MRNADPLLTLLSSRHSRRTGPLTAVNRISNKMGATGVQRIGSSQLRSFPARLHSRLGLGEPGRLRKIPRADLPDDLTCAQRAIRMFAHQREHQLQVSGLWRRSRAQPF
jgi:hypothetical protein